MLVNLETEQARSGHTDEYVAGKLGISQEEYRSRKASGAFLQAETEALLDIYDKPFEYLLRGKA